MELKLREIGNSVGVILPKEVLAHLQSGVGDIIALSETPNGYQVTPSQSDFAKTMAVMEKLSQRYRNTLRELAK